MRVARLAFLLGLALVSGGAVAAHAFSHQSGGVARLPSVSTAAAFDMEPLTGAGFESQVDGPRDPEAISATIGPEVELPPDTIVFIESGCWSCDGPPGALFRVARLGDGDLVVDKVFEVDRAANPHSYVMRYEVDAGAAELRAFVCTFKYCGGLGYPDAGSEVTLFRSRDLGDTWTRDVTFPGYFYPLGTAGGRLLSASLGEGRPPVFRLGEDVLTPPAGAPAFAMAIDGRVYWRTETGLLGPEGGAFDAPGIVADIKVRDGLPLLAYSYDLGPSDPGFYLTRSAGADSKPTACQRTWRPSSPSIATRSSSRWSTHPAGSCRARRCWT